MREMHHRNEALRGNPTPWFDPAPDKHRAIPGRHIGELPGRVFSYVRFIICDNELPLIYSTS